MGISAATLATISAVTSTVGVAVSAYGAYSQAKAQKGQAKYQAQVAENNAQIARWQAGDAIRRGKQAKDEHRQKVLAFKGRQRAAIAGSGFEVNSDDALDILADTAEIGELDALKIDNNAAREAYGYQVQGSNAQAQAGLYRGKADSINPAFAAGSTLFDGVGSVAGKWHTMKVAQR